MSHCQKCHHRFSVHQPLPTVCPRCDEPLAVTDSDAWASIARLTNLAEVGYFADVLETEGLETRVHQHNEFSALSGAWQMVYVLQVPAPSAAEAARAMQQELAHGADESEADEDDSTYDAWDAGARSPGGTVGIWKPVVFALLAGGLLYSTRQVDRARPPQVRDDRPSLWEALTETKRVYSTDSFPGQTRSRLLADPRSRTVWLQEDVDGDGRIDRVRTFRYGKLNGEAGR